jgi:hypothetical protein
MKWLRVFSLFIALHLVAWVGAHSYFSANPAQVLVVVDTSFSMKGSFTQMQQWITELEDDSRYQNIIIATDKALIGELSDIKDRQTIFRTAFGRSSADSLLRYQNFDADKRYLLSDGSFSVKGYVTVGFNS